MAISEEILDKLRRDDPDVVGLHLSQEVESDADVARLVDALRNNTCFRSLTIQGIFHPNGIGDESARLLSTCKNLVFLDISDNRNITNRGAAAFAGHPSLETLFMRGCSVTPAGLLPFLNNDVVTDLRIATTPSPEEQVGESVLLKLEENASLTLEQRLSRLTADQLNFKLCQFIRKHSSCISKLPFALQVDAKKNPQEWEDAITTGFILSRNMANLKQADMESVAKSAEVFVERYMELREDQQRLLQFSPSVSPEQTKKRRIDEEMSPSLSPSI